MLAEQRALAGTHANDAAVAATLGWAMNSPVWAMECQEVGDGVEIGRASCRERV